MGVVQYHGGVQYCGNILSTVGDVQYRGGYLEYHGVFSTVGDIRVGGYLEYHGGYSVPWEYHAAHGRYHEYRGGKSFVI